MTELDVKSVIIEYLRYSGHYALRINSGKVFAKYGEKTRCIKLAEVGTPDIVACINGKFVGLEVKKDEKTKESWKRRVQKFIQTSIISPYNQREVAQYKAMKAIEKSGGDTYLVCSVDEVHNICQTLQCENITN